MINLPINKGVDVTRVGHSRHIVILFYVRKSIQFSAEPARRSHTANTNALLFF